MTHRFFVEPQITSQQITLSGSESHHLRNVLRLVPGDEVMLFDGTDREHQARVARVGRSEVLLDVLCSETVSRELKNQIVVGVALPKGDRQRWLVEKLVELGAARLAPLRTERSVVHPSSSALMRLRRAIIEASKQCGRNQLMKVDPVVPVQDYIASPVPNADRWIADPGGVSHFPPVQAVSPTRDVYLLVGPEGGFTDVELQLAASSGWCPISLGERILRIETAAVAMTVLASFGLYAAPCAEKKPL